MGKDKLDSEIYPDNYYLEETSSFQHYGNVLLTSMKKMEGNVCININFYEAIVSTPSATYSVETVNNYNNVVITPTARSSKGWINDDTVSGNSMSISIYDAVSKQIASVKSTLSTATVYPETGKYFYTITVNPLSLQTKNITPSTTIQNISADSGYDGLSQVVVNPVPSPFTIPAGTFTITSLNSDNASSWDSKTWAGLTSFNAQYIWTDGENIYYSNGSTQYVLNKATSTWTEKIWGGLSNFNGTEIWTDGENIYYSSGSSNQYVLNKSNDTWIEKQWNGLTSFRGTFIWTDGENIYLSANTSQQYILNKSTSTWNPITWEGLSNLSYMNATYIWTDGVNIYLSGSTTYQYVLNKGTFVWNAKNWNGYTPPVGQYIWKDNSDNIYYSADSNQYVLDKSTDTWSPINWNGDLTNFYGINVWSDGENIYYSKEDANSYVLNIDNKKTDIGNYKYVTLPTENKTITPTTATQTITPTSGKVIKEVVIGAAIIPTGKTIITQQNGFTVSSYAKADVQEGTITSSTSSSTSTYILDLTPPSFRHYISIYKGWLNTGVIRIQKDANLVESNIKSGIIICGITGTYEGGASTYDGYYVIGTST